MKNPNSTPKRPARRTHSPSSSDPGSSSSGSSSSSNPGAGNTGAGKRGRPKKALNPAIVETESAPTNKPISINLGVLRRSKHHARELGIKSLKEYTESALLYFVKNGLNPTESVHSQEVSVEVVKLRNHIFSFLQKQEQAYILPIFREITSQGNGVEKSLEKMIAQLEKVYELLYRINQMVHVSTSTTLFVSGLSAEQIEHVKAKNKAFVDSQVSEFVKNK